MVVYDDKTKKTIKSGSQLLITEINCSEDVTFKASYVVSSDLRCGGKITALFNLVVFGDVDAEEIDVKGRFVCMGKCSVSGAIVVQDDIWVEDLRANSITCHNRIVAQSIDVDSIVADGNIIVGKTLAIEEKAQTSQNVMCGETAYGAGRVVASRILTVEPLDLDDGEEALESPFQYVPKVSSCVTPELARLSAKYASTNDYSSFLTKLLKSADKSEKEQYKKYLMVLKTVESAYPSEISKFKDVSLLFWMIEISNSELFNGWSDVKEWTDALLNHFKSIAEGNSNGSQDLKPATKIEEGYYVLHFKFGKGVVRTVRKAVVKGKPCYVATIDFESNGEKKFPFPESLKFFSVISENEASSDKQKSSLQCDIRSYPQWVSYLHLINQYQDYLGTDLYEMAYGLLLAKLGLKPKFVEDRFKEKGWK